MAYVPIMKLNKFTGKENNAQVWLNDVEKAITANEWNDARAIQAISYFLKDTANSWYQSLVNKLQDFNAFKLEFLRYFSNNNSINRLANTFTIIKQEETKAQLMLIISQYHKFSINSSMACAVAFCNTYVHCIQQDTVTHARDFESAELKANHAYTVNLMMNELSELDSKLKQFSDSINQKLEGYLADNRAIYQPPQQCNNPGNANHFQNQLCPSSLLAAPNQPWQPETRQQFTIRKSILKSQSQISNSELLSKSRSNYLPANNAATNLSTASISTSNLSTAATSNLSTTTPNNLSTPINSDTAPKFMMVVHQLISSSFNSLSESCSWNSGTGATQNPNFQNYLSLLITSEDATTTNSRSNQQLTLISNIPPATVTENELLTAIFSFEIEKSLEVSLFSRATIEEKPITAMYTDAKIDGHSIKLILDTNRTTKTPIGKIDNLPIEINGITVPIKMKTTECKLTTTANHAIENAMITQNDKASGTTNHVLLAVNSYSMKECGTTFLVKEERVMFHANTQFLSAIG
ncbi:hypothetical protein G9A89_011980 [Geosiphon pyriformis]|nr:hypothetical protein G9A89_011980 [Geosiphon pyriformis]